MKVILGRRRQNGHICRCYHTLLRNSGESTIRTHENSMRWLQNKCIGFKVSHMSAIASWKIQFYKKLAIHSKTFRILGIN